MRANVLTFEGVWFLKMVYSLALYLLLTKRIASLLRFYSTFCRDCNSCDQCIPLYTVAAI